MPGGCAKLTDVSQSTGNRLRDRVSYFTFPRSRKLPLTHPYSLPSRLAIRRAFRLHSSVRVFFAPEALRDPERRTLRQERERVGPPLSGEGEGNGVILQINLLRGHSDEEPASQPALVPRADYKFKCKPARSRGAKVRRARARVPSQVHRQGWRREKPTFRPGAFCKYR